MRRNVNTITSTVQKYLERHLLNEEDPAWEIRRSNQEGFGIFATRDINVGEVIFKDRPVILGPRAAPTCPSVCVTCFNNKNLTRCTRECGLLVCCSDCQNAPQHQKECKVVRQWQVKPIPKELSGKFVKVLFLMRSLLLSDEDKDVLKCLKTHKSQRHACEVDVMKNDLHLNIKEDEENFMRFVCSVMDSNAFEVVVGNDDNQSSLKGIYPLSSLTNHSCVPNTMHVFDDRQHMIVRATMVICKDSEIFHYYSRLLWGTLTRHVYLLETKHFLCNCQRCQDPTEFGSYMSAVLCRKCKSGKVIPLHPMTINGQWGCENCRQIFKSQEIAIITSVLGSALNSFNLEDVPFMLKLIWHKLSSIVPEYNESVVELKHNIIWALGHRNGYTWPELSDGLLRVKEEFCNDRLRLVQTLGLGQCRIRGLLLYELYSCLKERRKREQNRGSKITDADMEKLLLESSNILMYDASAPLDLQQFW